MSPYNRKLGPGLHELALGIWASIVIVARETPRMVGILWREEMAPRIATKLAPIVPHKEGSWIWRYDQTRLATQAWRQKRRALEELLRAEEDALRKLRN